MQNPTNPFISFTSQTQIIDQAGPAVSTHWEDFTFLLHLESEE